MGDLQPSELPGRTKSYSSAFILPQHTRGGESTSSPQHLLCQSHQGDHRGSPGVPPAQRGQGAGFSPQWENKPAQAGLLVLIVVFLQNTVKHTSQNPSNLCSPCKFSPLQLLLFSRREDAFEGTDQSSFTPPGFHQAVSTAASQNIFQFGLLHSKPSHHPFPNLWSFLFPIWEVGGNNFAPTQALGQLDWGSEKATFCIPQFMALLGDHRADTIQLLPFCTMWKSPSRMGLASREGARDPAVLLVEQSLKILKAAPPRSSLCRSSPSQSALLLFSLDGGGDYQEIWHKGCSPSLRGPSVLNCVTTFPLFKAPFPLNRELVGIHHKKLQVSSCWSFHFPQSNVANMQGKKLSDHSKANSQAWEAGRIRLINMYTSQPQGTEFFSEGKGR